MSSTEESSAPLSPVSNSKHANLNYSPPQTLKLPNSIVRHSLYWNYTSTDILEFYYDVHVDFDNWLLAGHKKLCFSSK
ncbi:3382_t:CDS:2, partial [Funneliformis caledonium]